MTSEEARKFSAKLKLYETRVTVDDGVTTIIGTVNMIGLHKGSECIWVGRHRINLRHGYKVTIVESR